jgi:hypothetical protein
VHPALRPPRSLVCGLGQDISVDLRGLRALDRSGFDPLRTIATGSNRESKLVR